MTSKTSSPPKGVTVVPTVDDLLVRSIAGKIDIEGTVMVNKKTDAYPDSKYFSFGRFSIQGDQQSFDLLLKKVKTDPDSRQGLFVKEKFNNEVVFYSQVVTKIKPILEKIRENNSAPHVPYLPDYFSHDVTEGKEWLAIEDLGTKYKAVPDPENLNKEYLKATVEALAAFHSASLIWKSANPMEFQAVAKSFLETEIILPTEDSDAPMDLRRRMINAVLTASTRACKDHLIGPYAAILDNLCRSTQLLASAEKFELWSVVTHGDCWAKNFLYTDDTKGSKVVAVAIVDFKCARVGSPVLDVANFLLSSSSVECLDDLRPFIEKHNFTMSPKIPEYRAHYHQFGPHGLVAALLHHFYCVRFPNLTIAEATCLIESPEEAEKWEKQEMEKLPKKTSASTRSGSDSKEAFEKRVALVVKAAHDVRMI